jgi:stage II sporulation SpoAA-like protein
VRERLELGDTVSFLVETAPDLNGLDLGALWEDTKAAGSIGLAYRSSWEGLAVVTDKDWIRHGIAAFGWLVPGAIRVFEPGGARGREGLDRRHGDAAVRRRAVLGVSFG